MGMSTSERARRSAQAFLRVVAALCLAVIRAVWAGGGGPVQAADPGSSSTVASSPRQWQPLPCIAQGPPGGTGTASPDAAANANTVTVDADATTTVKVSATPPDAVNEGTYPITVTITSDTGGTGSMQL